MAHRVHCEDRERVITQQSKRKEKIDTFVRSVSHYPTLWPPEEGGQDQNLNRFDTREGGGVCI